MPCESIGSVEVASGRAGARCTLETLNPKKFGGRPRPNQARGKFTSQAQGQCQRPFNARALAMRVPGSSLEHRLLISAVHRAVVSAHVAGIVAAALDGRERPRAILMRSARAESAANAQQLPQYCGMCWLRLMVQ